MSKMQKSISYPQKLGRLNFFSHWEIAELPKLLMPGEEVLGVISGFYTAGTAILCVTSRRLLLVDKKFIRLNYEDVRFGSIKEVNYSHQAFLASVKFCYAGRELQFKSWYRRELRVMAQFVQSKIFEVHEQQDIQKQALAEEASQLSNQDARYARGIPPAVSIYENSHKVSREETSNKQLERYLNDRIIRWSRASRFINSLPKNRTKQPIVVPKPIEHIIFARR